MLWDHVPSPGQDELGLPASQENDIRDVVCCLLTTATLQVQGRMQILPFTAYLRGIFRK